MGRLNYHFLNQMDAPRRVFALTTDELVIAVLGFGLLVLSSQKILTTCFSLGLLSGLRLLKKGESPRHLLVLAYWYLPRGLTQFFLPRLPSSHHRIYDAIRRNDGL